MAINQGLFVLFFGGGGLGESNLLLLNSLEFLVTLAIWKVDTF